MIDWLKEQIIGILSFVLAGVIGMVAWLRRRERNIYMKAVAKVAEQYEFKGLRKDVVGLREDLGIFKEYLSDNCPNCNKRLDDFRKELNEVKEHLGIH